MALNHTQALESSLRGWGYAVITDQKADETNTIALAYVIDTFKGGVLARLSTLSLELTHMYQLGVTGATPTSPVSVTCLHMRVFSAPRQTVFGRAETHCGLEARSSNNLCGLRPRAPAITIVYQLYGQR